MLSPPSERPSHQEEGYNGFAHGKKKEEGRSKKQEARRKIND
ncbi:hypothetical protein [Microcoleus sp. B4-D4]